MPHQAPEHGVLWLYMAAELSVSHTFREAVIAVQVSMAAGKAGAAQQRQQEREASAQRRAIARARAEKRAAVAAEQKADRGKTHMVLFPTWRCHIS